MNEQAEQLAAARRDWQLYHTLSEELLKFISQEDIDEFLSLTQQRTALVERMKKNPQTEAYRKTAECQALIEKIKPLDMQLIYKAKSWLNKSRRQNATVHAYDLTAAINPLGNLFNKRY